MGLGWEKKVDSVTVPECKEGGVRGDRVGLNESPFLDTLHKCDFIITNYSNLHSLYSIDSKF